MNAPTPWLLARKARAVILDPIVVARPLSGRTRRMPDWIARHPRYSAVVEELRQAIDGLDDITIWSKVAAFSKMFFLASHTLLRKLRAPLNSDSASWRTHWISARLRAVRTGDSRAVQEICAVSPTMLIRLHAIAVVSG